MGFMNDAYSILQNNPEYLKRIFSHITQLSLSNKNDTQVADTLYNSIEPNKDDVLVKQKLYEEAPEIFSNILKSQPIAEAQIRLVNLILQTFIERRDFKDGRTVAQCFRILGLVNLSNDLKESESSDYLRTNLDRLLTSNITLAREFIRNVSKLNRLGGLTNSQYLKTLLVEVIKALADIQNINITIFTELFDYILDPNENILFSESDDSGLSIVLEFLLSIFDKYNQQIKQGIRTTYKKNKNIYERQIKTFRNRIRQKRTSDLFSQFIDEIIEDDSVIPTQTEPTAQNTEEQLDRKGDVIEMIEVMGIANPVKYNIYRALQIFSENSNSSDRSRKFIDELGSTLLEHFNGDAKKAKKSIFDFVIKLDNFVDNKSVDTKLKDDAFGLIGLIFEGENGGKDLDLWSEYSAYRKEKEIEAGHQVQSDPETLPRGRSPITPPRRPVPPPSPQPKPVGKLLPPIPQPPGSQPAHISPSPPPVPFAPLPWETDEDEVVAPPLPPLPSPSGQRGPFSSSPPPLPPPPPPQEETPPSQSDPIRRSTLFTDMPPSTPERRNVPQGGGMEWWNNAVDKVKYETMKEEIDALVPYLQVSPNQTFISEVKGRIISRREESLLGLGRIRPDLSEKELEKRSKQFIESEREKGVLLLIKRIGDQSVIDQIQRNRYPELKKSLIKAVTAILELLKAHNQNESFIPLAIKFFDALEKSQLVSEEIDSDAILRSTVVSYKLLAIETSRYLINKNPVLRKELGLDKPVASAVPANGQAQVANDTPAVTNTDKSIRTRRESRGQKKSWRKLLGDFDGIEQSLIMILTDEEKFQDFSVIKNFDELIVKSLAFSIEFGRLRDQDVELIETLVGEQVVWERLSNNLKTSICNFIIELIVKKVEGSQLFLNEIFKQTENMDYFLTYLVAVSSELPNYQILIDLLGKHNKVISRWLSRNLRLIFINRKPRNKFGLGDEEINKTKGEIIKIKKEQKLISDFMILIEQLQDFSKFPNPSDNLQSLGALLEDKQIRELIQRIPANSIDGKRIRNFISKLVEYLVKRSVTPAIASLALGLLSDLLTVEEYKKATTDAIKSKEADLTRLYKNTNLAGTVESLFEELAV